VTRAKTPSREGKKYRFNSLILRTIPSQIIFHCPIYLSDLGGFASLREKNLLFPRITLSKSILNNSDKIPKKAPKTAKNLQALTLISAVQFHAEARRRTERRYLNWNRVFLFPVAGRAKRFLFPSFRPSQK